MPPWFYKACFKWKEFFSSVGELLLVGSNRVESFEKREENWSSNWASHIYTRARTHTYTLIYICIFRHRLLIGWLVAIFNDAFFFFSSGFFLIHLASCIMLFLCRLKISIFLILLPLFFVSHCHFLLTLLNSLHNNIIFFYCVWSHTTLFSKFYFQKDLFICRKKTVL